MKAKLYVKLKLVCREGTDKIVVRNFVKEMLIDGATAIADEIQMISSHNSHLELDESYVLKIENAKIRRLIITSGTEPWLFLFWENVHFFHGSTDKLFHNGWSETNYPYEAFLLDMVGKSE